MRFNPEVFFPNGDEEGPDGFELVLSTGYKVQIKLNEPEEGFTHLARALLGEVFLEALNRVDLTSKEACESVTTALVREITRLIEQMNPVELKGMLLTSIWTHFIREYDALDRKVAKKPKGKKASNKKRKKK